MALPQQITLSSQSNPPSRDLYTVVELQGAVAFDTATRTGIRVGDSLGFQEVQDYLAGPGAGVLIITKL